MIVRYTMDPGAAIPTYGSIDAAGADLYAAEAVTIPAHGRALVHTGLYLEIPSGYEVQIRPRSGLALKSGITVLNTPGTIDSDYRGEIGVILFNTTDSPFIVEAGDRIAQAVMAKHYHMTFVESLHLSATYRGKDGFGSTGVSMPENEVEEPSPSQALENFLERNPEILQHRVNQ